jgi:hypothetical protein
VGGGLSLRMCREGRREVGGRGEIGCRREGSGLLASSPGQGVGDRGGGDRRLPAEQPIPKSGGHLGMPGRRICAPRVVWPRLTSRCSVGVAGIELRRVCGAAREMRVYACRLRACARLLVHSCLCLWCRIARAEDARCGAWLCFVTFSLSCVCRRESVTGGVSANGRSGRGGRGRPPSGSRLGRLNRLRRSVNNTLYRHDYRAVRRVWFSRVSCLGWFRV